MTPIDSAEVMRSILPSQEQHFTVNELAERWHVDPKTVRRWVEDRDDVMKWGSEHRAGKRRHVSIRVPASVAEKVHAEMCGR